MKQRIYCKNHQQGVVSIVTVVLLSIILTLITTAFVRATLSNQRQALDNQMSLQAYYAAESGINDATTYLATNYASFKVNPIDGSTNCGDFMSLLNPGSDVLDSSSSTKYSCLLVSDKVPNILLSSPTAGQVNRFKITDVSGQPINRLKITWGNAGQSIPNGSPGFLSKSTWNNGVALLKLSLYFPTNASNLTRSDLLTKQKTFFLRPTTGGSNSLNATAADGTVSEVKCTVATGSCYVDINSIGTTVGGEFYIAVTPIYNSSSISIEAYTAASTDPVKIQDAQISIDATGRVNDVYRRVEVRRALTPSYDFPDGVVSSAGDLCKQFVAWPGGSSDEAAGSCSLNP
jgi:Tfp pilus assembly protein PilX